MRGVITSVARATDSNARASADAARTTRPREPPSVAATATGTPARSGALRRAVTTGQSGHQQHSVRSGRSVARITARKPLASDGARERGRDLDRFLDWGRLLARQVRAAPTGDAATLD